MKKTLQISMLFVLTLILTWCDEHSGKLSLDRIVVDRNSKQLKLRSDIVNVFKWNTKLVWQLEWVLNKWQELYDTQKILKSWDGNFDSYIKDQKDYLEDINSVCSKLLSNGALDINEDQRSQVKSQCDIGKANVTDMIAKFEKEKESACSTGAMNNALFDGIKQLVKNGNSGVIENEFNFQNYSALKKKFEKEAFLNESDVLILDFKQSCFEKNMKSSDEEDVFPALANILLWKKSVDSIHEQDWFLFYLFQDDIFKKDFLWLKGSFLKKYDTDIIAIKEKIESGEFPASIRQMAEKRIQDKIREDISDFLWINDAILVKMIWNWGTCYEWQDCFLYLSLSKSVDFDSLDLNIGWVIKELQKNTGFSVYGSKNSSVVDNLYEIRIKKWTISGKIWDTVKISADQINDVKVSSNTIILFIKRVWDDQSLSINDNTNLFVESKGAGVGSVWIGGTWWTNLKIGFDGIIPKGLEFMKMLWVTFWVWAEFPDVMKIITAKIDGKMSGIFSRVYKYDFCGKDCWNNPQDLVLFLNTIWDGTVFSRVLSTDQIRKLNGFIALITERSVALNYQWWDEKDFTGKNANPCKNTMFSNTALLNLTWCGIKGDVAWEAWVDGGNLLVSYQASGKIWGWYENTLFFDKWENDTAKKTNEWKEFTLNLWTKVDSPIFIIDSILWVLVSWSSTEEAISEVINGVKAISIMNVIKKSEKETEYEQGKATKIQTSFIQNLTRYGLQPSVWLDETKLKVTYSFENKNWFDWKDISDGVYDKVSADSDFIASRIESDKNTFDLFQEDSICSSSTNEKYKKYDVSINLLKNSSALNESTDYMSFVKNFSVDEDDKEMIWWEINDIIKQVRNDDRLKESNGKTVFDNIQHCIGSNWGKWSEAKVGVRWFLELCGSDVRAMKAYALIWKVVEEKIGKSWIKKEIIEAMVKLRMQKWFQKSLEVLWKISLENTQELEVEAPLASFRCEGWVLYKNFVNYDAFNLNGYKLITERRKQVEESIKKSFDVFNNSKMVNDALKSNYFY